MLPQPRDLDLHELLWQGDYTIPNLICLTLATVEILHSSYRRYGYGKLVVPRGSGFGWVYIVLARSACNALNANSVFILSSYHHSTTSLGDLVTDGSGSTKRMIKPLSAVMMSWRCATPENGIGLLPRSAAGLGVGKPRVFRGLARFGSSQPAFLPSHVLSEWCGLRPFDPPATAGRSRMVFVSGIESPARADVVPSDCINLLTYTFFVFEREGAKTLVWYMATLPIY